MENERQRSGRIGVIGGGLGGLASACTLAARGYDVVLFEKNAWLGGKAAVLSEGGFRFDMGPTILLMPSVLGRIFAEAGRDLKDELELIPLDPQWRSFFADGSILDLHADAGADDRGTRCVLAPEESQPGLSWLPRPVRAARRHLPALFLLAVDRLAPRHVRSDHGGEPLDPGRRPADAALEHGRGDDPEPSWPTAGLPDARPLHPVRRLGARPFPGRALRHRPHADRRGLWYPRGGTRAVAEAAGWPANSASSCTAGAGSSRSRPGATGRSPGSARRRSAQVPLAAVVSNCDSVRTHRELLAGTPAAGRFENRRGYEAACSGVVLYLGLDRRYDQLLHHNFVFSRDPHEEFDAIYRKGEPAPDPTCYVCAPAATEPDVAPPGGEALYVLVHTPYLRPHHDWKTLYPRYRQTILEKLKTTAGLDDIERRIKVERWLTPQDIHDRYRVLDGAIYGLASHGRFTGAFKPANRSPDVARLYLAGGAAHPGPGMPMVMMSGWIAADYPRQGRYRGTGPRAAGTRHVGSEPRRQCIISSLAAAWAEVAFLATGRG